MTTRSLPDAEARRRIREDLDATLFVEAAAGTGKTTELVQRIVSLLRSGKTRLSRIVAVTFTDKAAGEMKLRLRAEIERARRDPDLEPEERSHLELALEELEVARIGTIHSFCGDLLHERPVEARVDPLFEVAAGDEQAALLDRAFDSWFEEILEAPPDGVRRVLRRPRPRDGSGPRGALRAAAGNLVEHRDFPAAWNREPFDRDTEIDAMMETLAEVGALAKAATSADDYLARNLAEIDRFVEETLVLEGVRGRDHDGLEAALRNVSKSRFVHWHWKGHPRRAYAPDLSRAEVAAQRDAAKEALDLLVRRCDADLAPLLREELRPVLDRYRELKRRAGVLDFLDLLLEARNLVRGNRDVRGRAPAALRPLLRRRVPGHRPPPGRAPDPPRGRRPRRRRVARGHPDPGQALRGRRPQAVDLPLPPGPTCRSTRRPSSASPPGEPRSSISRPASGRCRASRPRSTPPSSPS